MKPTKTNARPKAEDSAPYRSTLRKMQLQLVEIQAEKVAVERRREAFKINLRRMQARLLMTREQIQNTRDYCLILKKDKKL